MDKVAVTALQVTDIVRRSTLSEPAPYRTELWPVAPADTLPLHFWRDLFLRAGHALLLFSILLVVVVPFVDNHYAQKNPYHDHIYLGGAVVEHDHPTPTASGPRQRGVDLALDSATGAISIPPSGAATEQAPQTVRTPLHLLLALPAFSFVIGAGCCERLHAHPVLPCDQPCLPPPDRPPRLAFWSF